MSPTNSHTAFRSRLLGRELLVGTFIKIPTSHATEILGAIGFDFVVIDEEHGPIGRDCTDRILLGARAAGTAGIVRVPEFNASAILGVLDMGAQGVLVPHIDTAEKAAEMVSACRYRKGNRGFSNTTRAGSYGAGSFADHMDQQDEAVAAIAMIEDSLAVECIEAIVATPGLDAIFIGRGDLAVALGETSMMAQSVESAVDRILSAAGARGIPVMVTSGSQRETEAFHARGVSGFIAASDQGFLRQAATTTLANIRNWTKSSEKG